MHPPSADEWFRKVYDDHHGRVLAYCIRRDAPDAEAATAETFLVAWRRRDELRDRDDMLPWLYGTARRVLSNQRRGRARLMRLSTRLRWTRSDEEPTPEVVVVRREQDRQVLAALDRLRPADREVIRLTVWEELSRSQVGDILGCSDRAVTMRLHRAVRRLERQLHLTHPRTRARALAPKTEATND